MASIGNNAVLLKSESIAETGPKRFVRKELNRLSTFVIASAAVLSNIEGARQSQQFSPHLQNFSFTETLRFHPPKKMVHQL
jgi:hypothetical protein